MNLKNHTYYFSKIPTEYCLESSPDFPWEPYYFRIVLDGTEQEFKIEDTYGRMVPFCFDNLCEMRDTLSKIIMDIATSSVGAHYNEVS